MSPPWGVLMVSLLNVRRCKSPGASRHDAAALHDLFRCHNHGAQLLGDYCPVLFQSPPCDIRGALGSGSPWMTLSAVASAQEAVRYGTAPIGSGSFVFSQTSGDHNDDEQQGGLKRWSTAGTAPLRWGPPVGEGGNRRST